MEKDNKRYSIFASQDIVSNLKKGRNRNYSDCEKNKV